MIDAITAERLRGARGILFDLDNTLYPRDKGVFALINEKINEFVRLTIGDGDRGVDSLRKEYLVSYGTTLGGLVRHHAVDVDEYLQFVHDVPVEELLEPDQSLKDLLRTVELPMVIFTNGTCSHAVRVMRALDIEPFFTGICDLAATGFLGKPHRGSFDAAADMLGCTLERAIFVDDLPVNIEAGGAAGAVCIHVNGGGEGVGDLQVSRVGELDTVFSRMPWYGRSGSGI